MLKKSLVVLFAVTFAFGVLFVSVFRTASVKYGFNPAFPQASSAVSQNYDSEIDYYLPYPGKVLPGSFFWPLKAMRDKLWLLINTSPTREAELNLLFADKRLGSAKILFDQGNIDDGFSSLSKAEKYLEEASLQEERNRKSGIDTSEFLVILSKASLKHYGVIAQLLLLAPDNAKPQIIGMQEYPKKIFERARNGLLEKRIDPPKNPFDWQ